MTIIEMHDRIDLLMDKADAPWFNSTEKDDWINQATLEFVFNKHAEFEFNEKRREDLLTLVRTFVNTNTSTIATNTITPEFLFALNLSGDFDDNACGLPLKGEPIRPLQLDDYKSLMRDPFNKPTDENPSYIQRNNGTDNLIEVLSDTTPTRLELNYLKYPVAVFRDVAVPTNNVDSDLPAHTHDEIVNIAVRKMLANIESANYQVQIAETVNQEQNPG
jgi:hypothetical protein